MDFQKISKPWNLLYLRVLRAQKQCSKFEKFGLSTKNVVETQKCTKAAWRRLVLPIFNLPCQLWVVITFERVISLCWNFQDNLISYIPFIWKSFIRIWDGSCFNLWNFGPFDMQWPTSNIGKWDFLSTIFQCTKSRHLEYRAPWYYSNSHSFVSGTGKD